MITFNENSPTSKKIRKLQLEISDLIEKHSLIPADEGGIHLEYHVDYPVDGSLEVFEGGIGDDRDPIFSYKTTRNILPEFAFLPFQQFKDGRWKKYVLVTPDNGSLAVIDLETFAEVARLDLEGNQYIFGLRIFEHSLDIFDMEGKAKSEMEYGERNVREILDSDLEFESKKEYEDFLTRFKADRTRDLKSFEYCFGNFALVGMYEEGNSGSSNRLVKIDLSRISEGIMTEGEVVSKRFVINVPLTESVKLRGGKVEIAEAKIYNSL